MTLYISQENQTLLWQMIQKTQPFITVFTPSIPLDSKLDWFKSQIQKMYQQLPPSINREQLKQINRDTLANMIQDLTRIQASSIKSNTSSIDRPPYSRLSKNPDAPSITEYETQYRSLLETPKPNVPDFSEKIEDQPIPDMESLIKEHQRQREQELKEYGPPPIIPEQKTPLQIESKDPILSTTREMKEVTKRLESLENKLDEIIQFYKKSLPIQESSTVSSTLYANEDPVPYVN